MFGDACHSFSGPGGGGVGQRLSGVAGPQQNLVVAVFRPDRLPVSLEQMVSRLLGLDSVNPPTVNLQHIAEEETSPTEPVLMLTTPGADPSTPLLIAWCASFRIGTPPPPGGCHRPWEVTTLGSSWLTGYTILADMSHHPG